MSARYDRTAKGVFFADIFAAWLMPSGKDRRFILSEHADTQSNSCGVF